MRKKTLDKTYKYGLGTCVALLRRCVHFNRMIDEKFRTLDVRLRGLKKRKERKGCLQEEPRSQLRTIQDNHKEGSYLLQDLSRANGTFGLRVLLLCLKQVKLTLKTSCSKIGAYYEVQVKFQFVSMLKPNNLVSKLSQADVGNAMDRGVSLWRRKMGRMRKGTAIRVNLDEYGAMCDGSPKVSNSSPLVSPTTTINMPRGLYSIDVAATFGVPLTTVGDLHMLIKDIEAGKHDELLSGMTNEDRIETMDALGTICNSIHADNNNVDVIPCKISHVYDSMNLNVDESTIPSDPIVHSVDIKTKSTSYARATGASVMDQPKVNSNFCPLVADPVFDGVNISITRKVVEKVNTRFEHTLYGYFIGKRMAFPVVEYYARNNWVKHGLKGIMMNSKGFFFFKFDSRAGLEAVLEGVPWLILFEEDGISLIATFIGKPIMLDSYTSSMCNDLWGRSSFARCLIKVNSEVDLVDVVTIGIPSLTGDDFTKETIHVDPPIVNTSNVVTPTVEKTNDSFQMASKKKKRKGKSKSTNGGQFAGLSVKQNIRYEPKAITSAPKKGATNVSNPSTSSSMLKTTGTSSKKDTIPTSNFFCLK
ncbi:zinc knuckle CX2CX4HX4C containing protein [Tanacetum coccineum]